MRASRTSTLVPSLVVAALVVAGCAGHGTADPAGAAIDPPAAAAVTAAATVDTAPGPTVPVTSVASFGTEPTLAPSTLPTPPPGGTAAPAPPPALAWYTLDAGRLITWSTYEVRDRAGRITEHVALSRHVDLADSDWRVVVTTRPAGASVPVPLGAEPMTLGDRDARVAVGRGTLEAVWTAGGAVVTTSIDAPRATRAEVLDMAAHVQALTNEEAYWLAPVVSVPGSARVVFDADDARRFAGRVRSELLEAGLRVGEPEPSPDGVFYTGTTSAGAEVQLWVGPGVYSPFASGQQTVVGERTITSRLILWSGWRYELLLVAPERSWTPDAVRALMGRLSTLGPPLALGRTA